MALDFRQVQTQVKALGERAPDRLRRQYELRRLAEDLLSRYAQDFEALQHKVARAAEHDPNLRCALPPLSATRPPEALNAHLPLPPLPPQATLIAADGSQIPLDRNAPVEYSLVNVGAIQLRLGSSAPPTTQIHSELLYDELLFAGNHLLTDGQLALMRDQKERGLLADLAANAEPPVITFTDGPMEMWGGSGSGDAGAFEQRLVQAYLAALKQLYEIGATAAGYVDKPRSDLVVRLLEVMLTPDAELPDIKQLYPLRGVKDEALYRRLLAPGERSAVFQIRSAKMLQPDVLRTHFFYLNVGRPQDHWIARIEIPAWVAADSARLDHLHAVLVDQCRILGSRPFPYLLHRAHETAVVTHQEKEQVTQMIALELRARGAEVGAQSQKQALKELQGKTGYQK
jgi:hypothetical protein